MALIPLIQPPIMRLLTTRKEREIKMEQLRPVSKTEKIIFPIAVATVVILLIPDTAPLIGILMLGNLRRECGLTDRLSDTAPGVSAVPMAARVSQVEGQKANPVNFLLMHAMGPNVAGVIGSAVAAGFMLKVFGA